MKHAVTRFKSLAIALKELEPFVKDGQHLLTGAPFGRFGGMRSREAIANWLVCAAMNFDYGTERFIFTSDPTGGDGIIFDKVTQASWPTEHIIVPRPQRAATEEQAVETAEKILAAIDRKRAKGAAYASGKHLVIFLDTPGSVWFPNSVARRLPDPLHFENVWVVAIQGVPDGAYVYGVALLDVSSGVAPTWAVRIEKDFDAWSVDRLQ